VRLQGGQPCSDCLCRRWLVLSGRAAMLQQRIKDAFEARVLDDFDWTKFLGNPQCQCQIWSKCFSANKATDESGRSDLPTCECPQKTCPASIQERVCSKSPCDDASCAISYCSLTVSVQKQDPQVKVLNFAYRPSCACNLAFLLAFKTPHVFRVFVSLARIANDRFRKQLTSKELPDRR
jgi:hypothetical protein